MRKVRVGVLYGGPSAEHEVSCSSALSVIRALAPERYEPVAIGITREGGFRLLPDGELARLRDQPAAARAIEDRLAVTGEEVDLHAGRPEPTARVTPAGAPDKLLAELDVVFPALHGPFGEDGVLQGLLETLGVPYVGCGVLASAVGMDKVAMKRAFRAEGLPVTPSVWFDEPRWRAHPELARELRRPLFVKPCGLGSSIGISRVGDGDDLATAVGRAFGHDPVVIVEQGVTGRELECGVLGGRAPEASVVGEVTVAGGWFDYRQKYFGDTDPMIVPADLPPDVAAEVRRLSVRAFQAIGGWGLARVDFLYDEAAGRLYVNELNTMPGFTAHSMYPKVWAATGVAYPDLIARLITLAFQRQAERRRR
jgi:D-alanine-D-alanine ligase